nr:hypothetical protein [Tanacetum cinerariifolium]
MASNPENVRLSVLAKLQEALDEEDILADQVLTMMHRYADRFTNRRVEINNLMVLQDHPLVDYGKLKVIEGSIEKVRESEKKNFQRDNGDDASSTTSKRERSLVRRLRKNFQRDNGDDASSTTSKRERSLVWRCFEKIDRATPADKMAACHNCDRVFSVNSYSGTKNLKRHMLKCFNFEEGESR